MKKAAAGFMGIITAMAILFCGCANQSGENQLRAEEQPEETMQEAAEEQPEETVQAAEEASQTEESGPAEEQEADTETFADGGAQSDADSLESGGSEAFESYMEAYEAILNSADLQEQAVSAAAYGGEFLYDLIYVDEDEIPELVAGRNGYFVNLYTYRDGALYTLMDQWGYGAGGNTGYDYAPRKNSIRNYDADQAGAIMNTTFMRINEQNEIEPAVWIKSFNFIDKNGNGALDEEEEYGAGPDYINGEEASPEETAAAYALYEMEDYQPIKGRVTEAEVRKMLEKTNQ